MGIGVGLSLQVLVKNVCHYYPKKKGLISAIISSIGTLFGSSFSFLGELVINPKRESVINTQTEPYYSEEIANRSRLYFLFAIILIPISTIISFFLLYKYDSSCETSVNNVKEPLNSHVLEGNNEDDNQPKNDNTEARVSNSLSKTNNKQNIKKALKNFRFWRNILIIGAMPFIVWFESSTSRPYSVMIGVDGSIIGILSGTMSILSCITNPIWAFCVDRFGFRPTMKIISIIIICLSIYFCIFMDNPIFYVIGLYISNVIRGGMISSLVPHMMEVYGLRYYLTIGGLGRLFTQLFSFSAAVVSIVISIFRKGGNQLLLPYRIVSLIGVGFGIFGLILVFFETDEKFKFGDENETDKHKEEQELNKNNEEN